MTDIEGMLSAISGGSGSRGAQHPKEDQNGYFVAEDQALKNIGTPLSAALHYGGSFLFRHSAILSVPPGGGTPTRFELQYNTDPKRGDIGTGIPTYYHAPVNDPTYRHIGVYVPSSKEEYWKGHNGMVAETNRVNNEWPRGAPYAPVPGYSSMGGSDGNRQHPNCNTWADDNLNKQHLGGKLTPALEGSPWLPFPLLPGQTFKPSL